MHTHFTISRLPLAQGGVLALCRLPGSLSPIEDDVEVIRLLAPACVVTLTPADEMHKHGGGLLPSLLERHGIAWHHFPIADYTAPLPSQNRDWRALAGQLHPLLNERRTIVIHCLAGVGRSGMVTLRLLVERGASPADALLHIRAVRPGAVERPAQYEWAAAGLASN